MAYENIDNTVEAYIRSAIPNRESSTLVLDMLEWYLEGGGGTGGTGEPGGPINSVQVRRTGNLFNGFAEFTWNPATNELKVGNQVRSGLMTPINVANGQTTPSNLAVFDSTYKFFEVTYSLERGGEVRIGKIFITHNNSVARCFEFSGDTGNGTQGISHLEVKIDVRLAPGNVYLEYTSNDTGQSGIFKYSVERWL
jgi:hypothetical protein